MSWALLVLVLSSAVWASCAGPQRGTVREVAFVWSGGLEPDAARIVAGFTAPTDSVRLAVTSGDFGGDDTFYSGVRESDTESVAIPWTLDELEPDTEYRYAVEVGGVLDSVRVGRFRTPDARPFSYTVALASCASTGADRPVFDLIRRQRPLFFLHLGDFHYENIRSTEAERFRRAFRSVLAAPSQQRLYRSVPIAYVWDDHDYGPNDSDRRSPGRSAAREAYQEFVPHYRLGLGGGDVPIAQAFTVGRVHYILTDLRSARQRYAPSDEVGRTMMGEAQKVWFKERVLEAAAQGGVIVWVNTVPWIVPSGRRPDSWGGYARERQELADFFAEHGVRNLVMLSGDAHMVAIDDGTHSDFSTDQVGGFPVIHAGALARPGSRKGGPYSEGAYPNTSSADGQWVQMRVEDAGGSRLCLAWTGYRFDARRSEAHALVAWERCFDVEPADQPAGLFEWLFGEGDEAE